MEHLPSLRSDSAEASQVPAPRAQGTITHNDYQIAWICALHTEMAAARAMLDETHDALPIAQSDSNSYVLGRIGNHKIVIACLPDSQYGTNNAASVASNILRTFNSIRFGLLVGIGGGAPSSRVDIRLGDIVVGSRIMQYDMGKLVGDGSIQRTAVPRLTPKLLGNMVSNLRSKHELMPSFVPIIMREQLGRHPNFSRPNATDRLFQSGYLHPSPEGNCDECDQSRVVSRIGRTTTDPVIHYGAIASGNQVIKDAIGRDDLARELDVICFEMEAAGVVDTFPCLIIRGICDYSDSHKNKEWQRYAAATAAAYAREILEMVPTNRVLAAVVDKAPEPAEHTPEEISKPEHRRMFLTCLDFSQRNSRASTITAAHAQTCEWFLHHPDYKAWLDPEKLLTHHGFLWVSGKPGVGKSTIMKFAFGSMIGGHSTESGVVASFFFHARGEGLEKTISGMYRSLIIQLLEGYTDLQEVLDHYELVENGPESLLPPPLDTLKRIFRKSVLALEKRRFTCFIDALDECDEQQAIGMLQYFEDLTDCSTASGIQFRVCFSSRHYPYLDISGGIRLKLEDQPGHAEDLKRYVQSRLRVSNPEMMDELQPIILEKAAGIFLWVTLVVGILNKEDRRGRPTLKKRVSELPSGLGELFKEILLRDNENVEELQLSILWILHAQRPLEPDEYYHALWSGLNLKNAADSEIPKTSTASNSTDEMIDRYVSSSSKGLAEITKSSTPTVQFIHESVRDFLVTDEGLRQMWPDIGYDMETLGHETLKRCCENYIDHVFLAFPSIKHTRVHMSDDQKNEVRTKSPFLAYAIEHILYHADIVAKRVPQDEFLERFTVKKWPALGSFVPSASVHILYHLAKNGCAELIRTRLKSEPKIDIVTEGEYKYPLFIALVNNHEGAVAALLGSSTDVFYKPNDDGDLTMVGAPTRSSSRSPLTWAAEEGHREIVDFLLKRDSMVDGMDSDGKRPLSWAALNGHEAIVRSLIENGADTNAQNRDGLTPLFQVARNGHVTTARVLIEAGASINMRLYDGWTPLLFALNNGHEALANLFIDLGADISSITLRERWTPLQLALERKCKAVSIRLINIGASITSINADGWTPIMIAANNGFYDIVELLINNGASVHHRNKFGATALFLSAQKRDQKVVELLVDHGADINEQSLDGLTPLLGAFRNDNKAMTTWLIKQTSNPDNMSLFNTSAHGLELMVSFLLDRGANVNAIARDGSTALMINTTGYSAWPPLCLAAQHGNLEIASLLIQNGANVDISNQVGWTPLHICSKYGHAELAELLIAHGANVNATDSNGETALALASMHDQNAVVRLLISHGAERAINKFHEASTDGQCHDGTETAREVNVKKRRYSSS
ncbi:unnamed protein product [Clonostachys rosea]|uniref:Nucleoside phosphorylase domain-containing protein n=1 Tax=Bionectria ochroleuca TaxID=29856 RepID=A0ABY6U6B2_BIOOC|nr:unnamed protein product [Clonostachys rosea]